MLKAEALTVLASIKKELLSVPATTPKPEGEPTPNKPRPSTFKQRRARIRGAVFQNMCRRKDWASPVYR
jgi:hypothetical protein